MKDSSELILGNIIKLTRLSEKKFKQGNFKGAIDDKMKANEILKSKSILWNGPLGAFEYSPFDKSTISVANIIQNYSSKSQLDALAGGGDTLAAIKKAKANDAFKYLSTAGGAFLEWLEGNKSPGFIALRENNF